MQRGGGVHPSKNIPRRNKLKSINGKKPRGPDDIHRQLLLSAASCFIFIFSVRLSPPSYSPVPDAHIIDLNDISSLRELSNKYTRPLIRRIPGVPESRRVRLFAMTGTRCDSLLRTYLFVFRTDDRGHCLADCVRIMSGLITAPNMTHRQPPSCIPKNKNIL